MFKLNETRSFHATAHLCQSSRCFYCKNLLNIERKKLQTRSACLNSALSCITLPQYAWRAHALILAPHRDINYFMRLKMFFAVSFDRTSSLLKHLRCYQFHWWLYCDEVTQASSSLCFTNACDNLSIVWTEHNTAMAIHTLCREERFASKTSFSRSLPWATIGRILT